MATRFYMPNSGTPPVSPSFDSAWEQTGGADRIFSPRKGMADASSVSAMTNQAAQTVPITTTQQILSRQFVTEPIPYPVRLAGLFSMVVRVLEGTANANVFLAFTLRAVNLDGTNPRSVHASMANSGTEYAITAATRRINVTTITPINLNAFDRLVLEVGGHAEAPAAADTFTHRYGLLAQADFALTDALTTDLNPWWELQQDLWPAISVNRPRPGWR